MTDIRALPNPHLESNPEPNSEPSRESPPGVAHIQLDETDTMALAWALRRLPRQQPDCGEPLTPSIRAVLDRRLAVQLGPTLRSLRHHRGPAALVIDGLPLIDEAGPTPVDGTATDDRLAMTKAIVTWIVETMGVFFVGYPNIADGRFFHDVNPVRDTIRPLSSKGADLELPNHTDSAYSDHRPDYLVLWSIRHAPEARVLTGYAEAGAALDRLDPETRAVLRSPRFRLQAPTIADLGRDDQELSAPTALVTGPPSSPGLRLHATRTECQDPEAARALERLVAALDQVRTDVELTAGRMLILNNRRGVHCRTSFAPTYGPDERWLLRSYLLIDPWSHREPLLSANAHIALDDAANDPSPFRRATVARPVAASGRA